jgi:hypothetical protein
MCVTSVPPTIPPAAALTIGFITCFPRDTRFLIFGSLAQRKIHQTIFFSKPILYIGATKPPCFLRIPINSPTLQHDRFMMNFIMLIWGGHIELRAGFVSRCSVLDSDRGQRRLIGRPTGRPPSRLSTMRFLCRVAQKSHRGWSQLTAPGNISHLRKPKIPVAQRENPVETQYPRGFSLF